MSDSDSRPEPAHESLLLVRLLHDLEHHDWTFNWRTADALAELGEPAVPALLQALESEDGYVRNGAAIALGKIAHRDAVPGLLRALRWTDDRLYEDDEDHEARASAVKALGQIGGHDVCVALADELQKSLHDNAGLAEFIADALGDIGDPYSVPALTRLLEIPGFEMHKVASWALTRTGSEGIRALLDLTSNRECPGRAFAIRALGISRTPLSVPLLIRIVEDVTDAPRPRADAAVALGRVGPSKEVFPVLKKSLEDPNLELRLAAISGLGFLQDPQAFDFIAQCIAVAETRYVAIIALGELGDPRACDLLLSIFRTGDYTERGHVATSLGKLGCRKAVPDLVAYRDSLDDSYLSAAQRTSVEAALREIERPG